MIVAVDVIGVEAAAGPLTAAAFLFPFDTPQQDPGAPPPSKLTPAEREASLKEAQEISLASAIVHVRAETEGSLIQAHVLAVARVLERAHHAIPDLPRRASLKIRKDLRLPAGALPVTITTNEGVDDWTTSAAWLLAWKARSTEMSRHAYKYPAYGFETNLGWLSPQHREALIKRGPSPLHREWCKI